VGDLCKRRHWHKIISSVFFNRLNFFGPMIHPIKIFLKITLTFQSYSNLSKTPCNMYLLVVNEHSGKTRQSWAIAHSHIPHYRSFQKCDGAIALFVALLKSAIVQSHFLSLFSKVQMWKNVRQNCEFQNRTFFAL